jgi:hypothetical protein
MERKCLNLNVKSVSVSERTKTKWTWLGMYSGVVGRLQVAGVRGRGGPCCVTVNEGTRKNRFKMKTSKAKDARIARFEMRHHPPDTSDSTAIRCWRKTGSWTSGNERGVEENGKKEEKVVKERQNFALIRGLK